jgi:hypothetical protein
VNRYVVLYLVTLFVLIPIDFLFLGMTSQFDWHLAASPEALDLDRVSNANIHPLKIGN